MGGEVVRFVPRAYQKVKYEKMFENISDCARISVELVKNCTERALFDWELSTGQEITTLFSFDVTTRILEINRIGKFMRNYLEPILSSKKTITRSVHIATRALKNMYIKP